MAATRLSPEKKRAKFIRALKETGVVRYAAEIAIIDRQTAYRWKQEHPEFREAWDEAVEASTERMEQEATRRAVDGVKKPVYQGGELVGFIQEYSDTLLMFMLKSRNPKYRDKLDVKGDFTHQVNPEDLTDAELVACIPHLPGRSGG